MPLLGGVFLPSVYLFTKLFKFQFAELNSVTVFVNGLVIYFFVLINMFPYMCYFPINSVFAFAICYHLWGAMERPQKLRAIVQIL